MADDSTSNLQNISVISFLGE